MTVSLRIEEGLARRLAAAAKGRGIPKSELIRRCLEQYLDAGEKRLTAWELGKHLFACYDSGRGDLSERSEEIIRERIHARRAGKSRRRHRPDRRAV